MGVVWEAVQEGLGRSVALKVLHPHLLLSERAVERFRREAEAGGKLHHPALVLVHAIGAEDGVTFLAQELLEGGSLADHLAALRAAEAEPSDEAFIDTARLFARLAEGLSAAHEAGIVHRDVKPSNVLFDRDGHCKLGDFGLATVLDGSAASLTGDLACTVAYASPEQLRGEGGKVDARTDVYSLGVSLYEALTLRRPFEGDAPHSLIRRILHDEPPEPRQIRSRIPRDLALICMRAMEKNPSQRYSSARELADDLGRFLQHEPVRAQ
jgi:serine/threonine protein kinase